MSVWTLVLHHTPLVARTLGVGNGQIADLSKASQVNLTFNLDDAHNLTFSLPGRHPTSALVRKGLTDVVAYCDDLRVMRFRVTERQIDKTAGLVKVNITCTSVRGILDHTVFHGGETRSWVQTQQAQIAWEMITGTQARPYGYLGIARGLVPPDDPTTVRTRVGLPGEALDRNDAYTIGSSRGSAITALGRIYNGFEWDVEPTQDDAASDPLLLNVWRKRGGPSTFQLDDGGNVQSVSMLDGMGDFDNVLHATGATILGTQDIAPLVWYPTAEDPTGDPALYGRWEKEISVEGVTFDSALEQTRLAYDRSTNPIEEWTVTLKAGRWQSPADLWLGDSTTLLVFIGTAFEDGYAGDPLVDIQAVVRVQQVVVSPSGSAAKVVMKVGRKPNTFEQAYDGVTQATVQAFEETRRAFQGLSALRARLIALGVLK